MDNPSLLNSGLYDSFVMGFVDHWLNWGCDLSSLGIVHEIHLTIVDVRLFLVVGSLVMDDLFLHSGCSRLMIDI